MMLTHILFDFFGTLVTYSANHIGQDYGRSYHLLVEQSVSLTYETFVQVGDSYTADYLGAKGAGLACLLLDPHHQHKIPAARRLQHILELPTAIANLNAL